MNWFRRLVISLGILFASGAASLSLAQALFPTQVSAWLAPVNVPQTEGSSYHPRLVIDAQGTIHMAWMDWVDLSAHPPYLLYASRPAGGAWTAYSHPPGSPLTDGVSMVIDASGNLHIALSGYPGVAYLRRNTNGTWSIAEPIPDSGMLPDIAVTPDGTVHIVWLGSAQDLNPNPDLETPVFYSYRPVNGLWSPRQLIYRDEYASSPMIASDTLGNLHVVLGNTSPNGRNEYTLKPPASPWTAPTPLPFDTVLWTVEQFASDAAGVIHLTWGEMDWSAYKNKVQYAYIAPGGGWSLPETVAYETYPVYTAVAGDCLGLPHIIWTMRDQEDNRLRYAHRHPELGWAVSTSQEMTGAHVWQSEDLSLAVACPVTQPTGGQHAAWDTGPVYVPYNPNDGRGEIFYSAIDGEPHSSILLTPAGGLMHAFSGSVLYQFGPASVLNDTLVTHTPAGSPPTGNWLPIQIFELSAERVSDGLPLSAFQLPYTLTVTYSPVSLGTAIESSLQVYAWDGSQWNALPGTLDRTNDQVTTHTDWVGYLALLGETQRIYLPLASR